MPGVTLWITMTYQCTKSQWKIGFSIFTRYYIQSARKEMDGQMDVWMEVPEANPVYLPLIFFSFFFSW